MTRPEHDDATDRQLRLLVGFVVLTAAVSLGWSGHSLLTAGTPPRLGLAAAVAVVLLIAACRLAVVRVRVRATHHAVGWTEAGILVALTVAPAPWVVACTALAVGAVVLVRRLAPVKAAFGVAKDVVVATVGALLVLALDVAPTQRPLEHLVPLAGVYLAMNLVDEAVTVPVIAAASRTSVRERLLAHWDLRLGFIAARFGVVVVALALLEADGRLLVAVPPIVLCLHLWHSARLRVRAEQQAWHQLTVATDGFTQVDLSAVLHTATRTASALFSADRVDVEIWLQRPPRLVRGDRDKVLYDGPADSAPTDETSATVVPLEGGDGAEEMGRLWLRFRGAVALSEREQLTLRTFASALCTAVRNASAYAQLEDVAEAHAHAATHDSLTGLANRRYLLDRAAELLSQRHGAGRTALLLIDLNHFKEINDTLGHSAGDQVLMAVARRLRAAAGPADLVARLGGDEFAVLLTGLQAPALARLRAEGVLAGLHEVIEVDAMRISVEASAGLAVAPGTGDAIELLRRSDVAMYQAKRSGQRIAEYALAHDTADVGRLTLGGDLPRAVAEHQFTVNFQPIVDLATGAVVAAEALARWRHPDLGDLGPRRFLYTVERSGLLAAFANEVLEQALLASIDWRNAGFDLPVAVNVSPRSLLDPHFPSSVIARLRAHDLPTDRLILELTETLTISQVEVVDRALSQLRAEGIRLALDDFGTGYSSLSMLSRVAVHEVKIDRMFVSRMETSAEAAAVVRSTVELARNLDLDVVAEGVESKAQRLALWELGCGLGQGHLFARPMPATMLLAQLRRGSLGRAGTLAPALHEDGAVVRIRKRRRAAPTGERQQPDAQA